MKNRIQKIKEFLFPGKLIGFRIDFERENGKALCFLLISGMVISLCSLLYSLMKGVAFPTGAHPLEYVLFFSVSVALLIGYKKDDPERYLYTVRLDLSAPDLEPVHDDW